MAVLSGEERAGAGVLVLNAGSTSLKVDVVAPDDRSERLPRLDAAREDELAAVAHRVVHGGPTFRAPALIDESVQRRIFELEALAPLHNEPALAVIELARRLFPSLPQIAVFDTAFHATMTPAASTYAVPRRWREEWGVRRYGFHGLSVAWSARRAPELLGRPPRELRLVVCHLGGGSSVSAVRDGRSVDTTMGFSPLEGVPMSTRSGSIDPGAVVYLLEERSMQARELEHALNFDAGMKALAGGSGDMLQLEAAAARGDGDARLARDVFVHHVAGAAAAMAISAGGLDALIFTGGIGEGSATVRERVCERLEPLGVELDRDANSAARAGSGQEDRDLASGSSRARVLLIHAREELVAARQARELLGGAPSPLGGCGV